MKNPKQKNRRRHAHTTLSALFLAIATLSGCGDSTVVATKVGLVTDTGGISDRSFNATAWKGVQDAQRQLGIASAYLESQQASDYALNIQNFADKNYELIVTVGFPQAEATQAAAAAYPGRKFAIVDAAYSPALPNVMGLTFKSDEAAFLAGYLAAGMSQTAKVGTFGGTAIPPVTIFMVGFEKGVQHYNQVKGKKVEVIGWKTDASAAACGTGRFTGTFVNLEKGRLFANQLMDEGADIVLPLAGTAGLGAAAAIQERAKVMIGVDSDQYIASPDYQEIYLTSILKNSDQAIFDVIQTVEEKTFQGGTYLGSLKNKGVGLAPYHALDTKVPAWLKSEIEQLKQDTIRGTVDTGWGACAS